MHDQTHGINPYLQQEVLSASLPRLRWMLVKRAQELCGLIDQMWRERQVQIADQWSIRLRDILIELLSGVQDAQNPVSTRVADFYVFLLQLLSEFERTRDGQKLQTLEGLLRIEEETWRLVAERHGNTPAQSLPLETADVAPAAGLGATIPMTNAGFSLEV